MRWLVVVGLVVTGCAGLPGLASGRTAALFAETKVLELARHPGGERWTLAQERGKVVVLDLWASWCEPCKEALPAYEKLAAELGPQGLTVYAVSLDADVAQVGPFIAGVGVNLPVLLDPGGAMAESVLKVQVMPSTFVFDRHGTLVHSHSGWDGVIDAELRSAVDRALAEPPRSPTP